MGITGFPMAGESILFDALCLARGVAPPAQKGREPRIAHLPLSDSVFDRLAEHFKPKKVVPPALDLIECPELPSESDRIHALLSPIAAGLSLIIVVCGGPATEDDFSPDKVIAEYFRALSDQQRTIVERRIQQIRTDLRKGKKVDAALAATLESLQRRLLDPHPIPAHSLTPEETKIASSFVLVTAIPHFVVANIDKADRAPRWQQEWNHPFPLVCMDVSLEKDLMELPEAEREDLMASFGLQSLVVTSLIDELRRATNRNIFYTLNERELHAWDVPAGATALQAAGVIHSDMERGFIRAEIITANDLLRAGSLPKAHLSGLVRSEGKDYVVQDRDVLNILFNV